jgi:hypothetical protein
LHHGALVGCEQLADGAVVFLEQLPKLGFFGEDFPEKKGISNIEVTDGGIAQELGIQHEDLLILNDDVVLNPTFHEKLVQDLQLIPEEKRGWVAARADFARGMQNVRWRHESDPVFANSFPSEEAIIEVDIIAPYAGYIHRDAWMDFPPLNNYSDDVQCLDMREKGLRNYISRAYVHHVGGASTGRDWRQLRNEAIPWIAENRPDYAPAWFPEIQKAS